MRLFLPISEIRVSPSSHPLHLLNKLPRILRTSGPKLIQPSIQPLSRIRHRPHLNSQPRRDLLPFLESSADALEQVPQLRLRSQERAEFPHEPPDYQPALIAYPLLIRTY